ncbi:hypothetical protein [Mycobacterium sp. GA-2829]|uniref:hypothetical protein n=1 Tax=Mycobacterium sp. GA-2829 TaxID=1772283 RepID=UPI0007400150|nr:hypothetical protein [Mycobacterium sp. GA-2829]KUI28429.1 hypothetical protein AU194_19455 [Mycobacterium sp. GA-2829]
MILRRLLRHMQGQERAWPRYMPGGRVRTSTLGLIVAFIALFWLYQVYEPPVQATAPNPAQQVVPPGFVPDPDYTWVPRTQVQEPPTTRRTWTTTTTTTTPTTTTTSPSETTTSTPTSETPAPPTTTVVDPDGPGLLPPRTVTQTPSPVPGPFEVPGLPVPLP